MAGKASLPTMHELTDQLHPVKPRMPRGNPMSTDNGSPQGPVETPEWQKNNTSYPEDRITTQPPGNILSRRKPLINRVG
jgi:hypothetical protein